MCLHNVGKECSCWVTWWKYVALKRTAEDRKQWQKLIRAGSHRPVSQQITWMNVFAFSALTLLVGTRKSIWSMRWWHGHLSAARCKWFAYSPADAAANWSSRFIKIQIGLMFRVLAHPGCPGIRLLNGCLSDISCGYSAARPWHQMIHY